MARRAVALVQCNFFPWRSVSTCEMGEFHFNRFANGGRTMVMLLPLLVAMSTAGGCATATTSSQVADSVVAAAPGCVLERESRLVLSRASMAIVRALSGLAGDDVDEEAREILRGVRRVEVVSYRLERECDFRDRSLVLVKRLADEGWQAAMSMAEAAGEWSWVLTREAPDGETSGMLVIALDRHELEVVRLDGGIDRVLVAATVDEPSIVRRVFDSGTRP